MATLRAFSQQCAKLATSQKTQDLFNISRVAITLLIGLALTTVSTPSAHSAKMDLRELLEEGGPAVQCPVCRGPVDPQGCGPDAVHVFPCCPRSLFHLRCLATSNPGATDDSEVRCPVCPEGVRSHADVEWFGRQCHINGVEFPQVDCATCTVCTEEMTIESSISLPCCHQRLHVTCLARSLSSGGVDCPFCNQSLQEFAKSASLLFSMVVLWMLTSFFKHTRMERTVSTVVTGQLTPRDHTKARSLCEGPAEVSNHV